MLSSSLDLLAGVVAEDSTQGVPQSDGSESVDAEMESRLRELRIGDTPDSMPSLPNVHEKADMVLAYSTVTGNVEGKTYKC